MADRLTLAFRGRNPDVLTCIANLSNDEVFTPPELANRMLDDVAEAWAASHDGDNIWADKTVKFLDPFTKSGVFLREITKRLVDGLASQMPDIQRRVDHILTRQVYGIAITELTALLARRSVYCSKWAAGQHSVCRQFDDNAGHIWFEPRQHTWVGGTQTVETADGDGNPVTIAVNGRCSYCGASRRTLDRAEGMETHAYAMIHTHDPRSVIREAFGEDMQFDVIIGNPPYQMNDGGGNGTSAAPIYQLFVEAAKKLEPRFLTVITPSRWFSGGKGLDEFRETMLSDNRIREIHDYLTASEVFSGIGLKGGVSYFLWDRDHPGDCHVTTQYKGEISSTTRPLLEPGADVFVRFNEGLAILKKVAAIETVGDLSINLPDTRRFDLLVSARKPFGLDSAYAGRHTPKAGDLTVFRSGGIDYTPRASVSSGTELIDAWKVFVGKAAPGTGNKDTYPHRIISTPFVAGPGQVSTETYLCIGPFKSESEANNVKSYLSCRLTRLLIALRKASQNTTRSTYAFVPVQDFSKAWTDADLYAKYGITDDEVSFIETLVRPMNDSSDSPEDDDD